MVARALWRSEALRAVPWPRPCTHLRLASGSPTKAQLCVPLISTMHGQPFLILLFCVENTPACHMACCALSPGLYQALRRWKLALGRLPLDVIPWAVTRACYVANNVEILKPMIPFDNYAGLQFVSMFNIMHILNITIGSVKLPWVTFI